MPWTPLATLYKARGVPTKAPVCAICVDRTRGRTREVRLTHRVSVWLCEAHAAAEFQTRRDDRDFVRTLMGVWKANDCLTLARGRVDGHLKRLAGPPPARPCPGSYSWPALRRAVEAARYAAGDRPAQITLEHHDPDCTAAPPSRRTIQRWHAQQRWIVRPPSAVAGGAGRPPRHRCRYGVYCA